MGALALPDLPVHFFGEPKKGPFLPRKKRAGKQMGALHLLVLVGIKKSLGRKVECD